MLFDTVTRNDDLALVSSYVLIPARFAWCGGNGEGLPGFGEAAAGIGLQRQCHCLLAEVDSIQAQRHSTHLPKLDSAEHLPPTDVRMGHDLIPFRR